MTYIYCQTTATQVTLKSTQIAQVPKAIVAALVNLKFLQTAARPIDIKMRNQMEKRSNCDRKAAITGDPSEGRNIDRLVTEVRRVMPVPPGSRRKAKTNFSNVGTQMNTIPKTCAVTEKIFG